MMKKVWNISRWILAFGGFIFLAAFENVNEKNTRVKTVKVDLIQQGNQLFLNDDDIYQIITNQYDSITLKNVTAINSALLEESLKNQPFVADAEVFSTLDGKLSVQVKQKLAIARVVTTKKPYYLDADGRAFPVTNAYSASVPVFTGITDSTNIHHAFALMKEIKSRPYFTNWVAEIHTTAIGEFEIVPVSGKHRIIFGTAEDTDQKLEKLKRFYEFVVTDENLNEWKTLNVAYNNQLVSTKY